MVNVPHNPGRFYASVANRRSQRAVAAPRRAVGGTTVSGMFGFLGLLMGLFAIFVLVGAAVDWRNEAAQARWPLVSAVVERGEVTAYIRGAGDRRVRRWKLDYRVRFDLNGQEQIASISLPSATSESQARDLQSWAARHRRGERIEVRYDPSDLQRAIFASDPVPNAGSRTHSDLSLVIIFALASMGFVALAKHLGSGESREIAVTGGDSPSRGGRIALGVISAVIGFVVIGTAVGTATHAAGGFMSDVLLGVPAGLILVLGGALLGFGPGNGRYQRLLSAWLVTCFALTFDWVAFGPGERNFGGGIALGHQAGVPIGEFFGRAAFGLAAVVLDIFAIMVWIGHWTRRPQSQQEP